MAKKTKSEGVYRIVDVVGVSETSWEDAGRRAVDTAAGSLRDLRVAEVTKMDMRLDNGKVVAFRTRVALSFKYESKILWFGMEPWRKPGLQVCNQRYLLCGPRNAGARAWRSLRSRYAPQKKTPPFSYE